MPVKVLVQLATCWRRQPIGHGTLRLWCAQRAPGHRRRWALGGVFVLQSTELEPLRIARAASGAAWHAAGPALFSVFSGSPQAASELPPYLSAAAAMKSRAFPAFTYDANAGSNWATRFSLENNPQPADDWPVEELEFADEDLQRVRESIRFTFADFVLCDPRHARALRASSRGNAGRRRWCRWPTGSRCPKARRPTACRPAGGRRSRPAASRDCRCAPDAGHAPLPAAVAAPAGARRYPQLACRTGCSRARRRRGRPKQQEHRCAEAGSLRNSRRRDGEQGDRRDRARAAARGRCGSRTATVATRRGSRPRAARAATSASSSTTSCSATTRTNRPTSRTSTPAPTRQLVEAAEACQVAIIHPGKPRNPNEPGLEELLERAKPFL